MAYNQYLSFNGIPLPLPDSYDISFDSVEADTTGETEAGTTQRDVIRAGVVTISVSFSVSATWVKTLSAFSKKDKLIVAFFDTEILEQRITAMYVTGFKAKLEKDTSKKGLWSVSFTLNEF